MLCLRAEAQHVLDARPVIPAAVEDDNFARGRGMPKVALHVALCLLSVGRRWYCDYAEHSVADAIRDRLNHAALAGGVASFEDHNHPFTMFLNPLLQGAQLYL